MSELVTEFKSNQTLFDRLDPDIRAQFQGILTEVSFKAGQQIFAQGDNPDALYIVVSGRVKILHISSDGNEMILCMCGPNQTFCPVTVLDGGPQLGAAFALTDVKLLKAQRDKFCALLEFNPQLLAVVQLACLKEVRRFVDRLEKLTFSSLEERLAACLLDECARVQNQYGSTNKISITQQELANYIGASREGVSRLLASWHKEGIVKVARGSVMLLRPDLLTQLQSKIHSP